MELIDSACFSFLFSSQLVGQANCLVSLRLTRVLVILVEYLEEEESQNETFVLEKKKEKEERREKLLEVSWAKIGQTASERVKLGQVNLCSC